jgi:hypothetical protein
MRLLLIIAVSVFIGCKSKPREIDCSSIREGKFKTLIIHGNDTMEFLIYRDKYKQYEEDTKGNLKVAFRIKWLTDCSYELSERKMLKGEDPDRNGGPVMFVKITEATGNSFVAETTGTSPDGEKMIFRYERVP